MQPAAILAVAAACFVQLCLVPVAASADPLVVSQSTLQAVIAQPSLPAEQAALALQVNDTRLAPVPAAVTVLTSLQAVERKARMKERLDLAGTNFTFFAGLDGSQRIPVQQHTEKQMANERVSWGLNIDALKDFEVVPNGLCRNTTFQHYACTISHMLIIYQAYMRNESMLLVLEDDMEILRWPDQALLATAPLDWEILMLYSLGGQANDLYQSDNASLWYTWTIEDKLFNTGAYLINRSGMKKVVETYLPGAIQTGKASTVDFSSVSHSDGCHADLVIYLPVRTYFCTDLYFVEEGRDSILATNKNYLAFHLATRDIVRHLMKHRGFRHHAHRRLLGPPLSSLPAVAV